MNVNVSTDIVINRPIEQVSAFAADPDNVRAWYANITSIEWKTPPPVRVGAQVAFVAHFLGRRIAYTYDFVEFVPGRRLVMRTAEGPFPMETTYTWEPVAANATRMTLQNRGTPTGVSAWVAPFMAFAVRRANRKDLVRLKRSLESRP